MSNHYFYGTLTARDRVNPEESPLSPHSFQDNEYDSSESNEEEQPLDFSTKKDREPSPALNCNSWNRQTPESGLSSFAGSSPELSELSSPVASVSKENHSSYGQNLLTLLDQPLEQNQDCGSNLVTKRMNDLHLRNSVSDNRTIVSEAGPSTSYLLSNFQSQTGALPIPLSLSSPHYGFLRGFGNRSDSLKGVSSLNERQQHQVLSPQLALLAQLQALQSVKRSLPMSDFSPSSIPTIPPLLPYSAMECTRNLQSRFNIPPTDIPAVPPLMTLHTARTHMELDAESTACYDRFTSQIRTFRGKLPPARPRRGVARSSASPYPCTDEGRSEPKVENENPNLSSEPLPCGVSSSENISAVGNDITNTTAIATGMWGPSAPASDTMNLSPSSLDSSPLSSGTTTSMETKASTSSEELQRLQYLEKRRKNNEAAKKSRDQRKRKEEDTAIRAAYLENENYQLKQQIIQLRNETSQLRLLVAIP